MLEDRILVSEGTPQIYGTQVRWNATIKKYELFDVLDPINLDKRRVAVGMDSINSYLSHWGIKYDVAND